MEFINHLGYNSVVILTFFFISLIALILNYITKGKSNNVLFSSYRSSLLKPLTYVRLVTHIFGHADWNHFMNKFLYILLIGPMIEEKYGSLNLLIMILITATVIGLFNSIFTRNKILGASGITFMLIVLSSFVNFSTNKIPLTFILGAKDSVSHGSHFLGALCGFIFSYIIFPS